MTVQVEEVVGLAVVAWTAVLLAAVPAGSAELFAVLVFLGLFVVRALAGPYASRTTNARIDLFVYGGLVLFALFVVRRVYDVLAG